MSATVGLALAASSPRHQRIFSVLNTENCPPILVRSKKRSYKLQIGRTAIFWLKFLRRMFHLHLAEVSTSFTLVMLGSILPRRRIVDICFVSPVKSLWPEMPGGGRGVGAYRPTALSNPAKPRSTSTCRPTCTPGCNRIESRYHEGHLCPLPRSGIRPGRLRRVRSSGHPGPLRSARRLAAFGGETAGRAADTTHPSQWTRPKGRA